MTSDLTIQLRRDFEAWCKRDKYSCDKDSKGDYLFPASSRFASWCAAYQLYHEVGLESLVPLTDVQFSERQVRSEYLDGKVNKNNSK